MSEDDILRSFFMKGKEFGELNVQPVSAEEAFVIAKRKIGGLLACTNCYKILPVGQMYSVDACSERCQEEISDNNRRENKKLLNEIASENKMLIDALVSAIKLFDENGLTIGSGFCSVYVKMRDAIEKVAR